jgi:hypothetical protein
MTTVPTELQRPVQDLLTRFAHRRLRLLALRALMTATTVLLTGWIGLAVVDRIWIVPDLVRTWVSIGIYVAAGVAFLLSGGWQLILTWLSPPDRVELARMAETHDPQLRGHVRAAVELVDRPSGSAAMRQASTRDAANRADRVDLGRSLPRALAGRSVWLGLCLLVILVIAIVTPQLSHWQVGRMVARAALPGLDLPRAARVDVRWDVRPPRIAPVGEEIEVTIVASPRWGDPASEARLQVVDDLGRKRSIPLISEADGRFVGRVTLDRPSRLTAWSHRADTTTRWTNVWPRPAATTVIADYLPPPYLASTADERTVDDLVVALQCSVAELEIRADQPLASAVLEHVDSVGRTLDSMPLTVHDRVAIGRIPVERDGAFRVRFVGRNTGFSSVDEPIWPIIARPDAPPVVQWADPEQADTATADGLLPVVAEAIDDVALEQVRLEARIDAQWTIVEAVDAARTSTDASFVIDLLPFDLSPGDVVTFRVSAVDRAGNTSSSTPREWTILGSEIDPAHLARLDLLRRLRDAAASIDEGTADQTVVDRRNLVVLAGAGSGPASDPALRRDLELLVAAAHGASGSELRAWLEASVAAQHLAVADATVALTRREAEAALAMLWLDDPAADDRAMRRLVATARMLDDAADQARRSSADLSNDVAAADWSGEVVRLAEALADRLPSAEHYSRLRNAFNRLETATEKGVEAHDARVRDASGPLRSAAMIADVVRLRERAPDAALRRLDERSGLVVERPGDAGVDRWLADLALVRAAVRQADPEATPVIAEAAEQLDAAWQVRRLRVDARQLLRAPALLPKRQARLLRWETRFVRDALLTSGHDGSASRRVGEAERRLRHVSHSVLNPLDKAVAESRPTAEAARERLRLLLPPVADVLRSAAAAVREDQPDASQQAEAAVQSLRDEAMRQDLLDDAARRRAADALTLADRIDAAEAQDVAETLDAAADHMAALDAGESPAPVDSPGPAFEELDRLAELAQADREEMLEALEDRLDQDQAMREALEAQTRQREQRAADALERAAAAEEKARDSVAEAIRNQADDEVDVFEAVARDADTLAGEQAEPDTRKPLESAAKSARRRDPQQTAEQLRDAADALTKLAEAQELAEEEAAAESREKAQAASEAFQKGDDFETPFREHKRQEALAEAAQEAAAEARADAKQAREMAERVEQHATEESASDADTQAARQDAAEAQEQVAERLEEAAQDLDRAAENRRALGQEQEARTAQAAAEAARSAAASEVAEAADASAGEASDADALAALERAAAAIRRQANQAKSAAPGEGGQPAPPGESGDGTTTSSALAQAMDALSSSAASAQEAAGSMLERAAASAASRVRRDAMPPTPGSMPGSMPGMLTGRPNSTGETPATSMSQTAPAAAEGDLGTLPEADDAEWGTLPPELVRRLNEGRRDAAPPAYRDQVERYYRLLAERARRQRESQP